MDLGFAILASIALLAVTIPFLIAERQKQADFEKRFPAISDDQFMALCPPGTNREIALKVRRIVSDCSGIDYEQIYPSSNFFRDLDFC